MLSICIPIYNFDVRSLVNDLHREGKNLAIDFQIICLDDKSSDFYKSKNRELDNLENVDYIELDQNIGRSRIRNELGKKAKYDYLLFMDCDSKVVSKNYLKSYIENLDPQKLLYGGRVYQLEPPEDSDYYFHWKYGTEREVIPCEKRQSQPYHSFMTNNFLIPKRIFLSILFDESLNQYGHEDTIFGLELKERGIPILHIENPLEHIGLEKTEVFLNKTKKGIQNLWGLSVKNDLMESRLLNIYKRIKEIKLNNVVGLFYDVFENSLTKMLSSKNPNMLIFDLYKLGYLCLWAKKNSKDS